MKRLLFIAHRVPYPPDKGERVRALEQIKALSPYYRLTVAAFAHGAGDCDSAAALRQWAEKVVTVPAGGWGGMIRGAVSLLAGRSVGEGVFRAKNLLDLLREESRQEPFDLVVASSSTTLPVVLGVPAGARVMDLVDVDSAKWYQYAANSTWPMRWVYRREAEGIRRLERLAIKRCDAVVVISSAEAAELGPAADNVVIAGNGVDGEYFKPAPNLASAAPSIVFTGTMSYRPNAEGVCWFVREVWPELRKQSPQLTFVIVGRDPTRSVLRLARIDGVEVIGAVPDVRPYLAAASLAVAPLHMARGVQNKILEAMAAGRAVVASPEALAGLEVAQGSEVLSARMPREWQDRIRFLLADPAARSRVEQAARARVLRDYVWSARLAPLVALCRRLAPSQDATPPVSRAEGTKQGKLPIA